MKNLSDMTAEEVIAELEAPEPGPRLTRLGLITRLVIIAKLRRFGHKTALDYLRKLAENGSEAEKAEIRTYFIF